MSRVAGPSTMTPSDGSRTILIHDSQPREDQETTVGVLHLRATANSRRVQRQPRVTWTEDVVDNEGMGKKKSKLCCLFHKQRRYDESSSSDSDSSDSDSDSDGGAKPGGRLRDERQRGHSHPHPHGDQNESSGGSGGAQAARDGDGSTTVHELPDDEYVPNAYERQPGKKKGKGKKVEKGSEPTQSQPD